MKEHTPGPWEARDVSQPCIEILGNEDAEGTKDIVAAVLGQVDSWVHTEEQWANARLISAAPDLLFACRKALCELGDLTFDMDNYESPNLELLRAAIMKAEVGA